MKQGQDISEDGEIFWNIQAKCKKKNMLHLEEVCNVILVSEDNERIRAHKVFLWVPLQGHLPDGWQEYMFWIDPYERCVLKIHNICAMVDFVYNDHSTVNERNCEDILKSEFNYPV